MKYNPINIAAGLFILITFSYFLVTVYSFIYLKFIAKAQEVEWPKIMLSAAVVSVAWLASTVIAIWLASSVNLVAFATAALVLFFTILFFSTDKLFGIKGKKRIPFALVLALIMNPVWFSVLGIIK